MRCKSTEREFCSKGNEQIFFLKCFCLSMLYKEAVSGPTKKNLKSNILSSVYIFFFLALLT